MIKMGYLGGWEYEKTYFVEYIIGTDSVFCGSRGFKPADYL